VPEKSKEEPPKHPQVGDVLQANLSIITKAVANKEARLLFGRVLRTTASVRSQFTAQTLHGFFSQTLQESSPVRSLVLQYVLAGDAVRC
jgi:hypothetical protein